MIKTKYDHYYIEDIGNGNFKVYSDKTGVYKELKQSYVLNSKRANAKPYIQVGVKGCQLLHRLIASTFIGNIDGLTVNHKDGNTLNNTIENLEIVTQSKNNIHAIKTGLMPTGEKHGKAKYTDKELLTALREIKAGASVKSTAKNMVLLKAT
jgi:hypothetical protein